MDPVTNTTFYRVLFEQMITTSQFLSTNDLEVDRHKFLDMSSGTANGSSMELGECIRNTGFHEDDKTEDAVGGDEENRTSTVRMSPGGEEDTYTQIKPYAGMPKEVLLLYSGQARYRLPREILFWLTVASTLALVALTITVVVLSPRCLSWWQSSPVYQIYPRSFKDSDSDGIGDLKGIVDKLDHFQYLNIKAIWISPFYKSPMKDFGYDVEDFRDIDPLFGSMQDFDDLLAAMHDKGLKLIMDFIPNHTSDTHKWFNLSSSGHPQYKDYYIWTNCNTTHAPNNWVSVFGNSSWTYVEERQQCYYHQFLKEQPDLNFRNPHEIVRFWLEKGVDGFRMDAVKHILEAKHLRDEPQVDPQQDPDTIDTEFELHHDYTTTQLGLHDILQDWRGEMDVYTESYDYEETEKTMMYYGTPYVKESDFPFNFYLMDLPTNLTGTGAQGLVNLWMANMPVGKWPNWVVGNHDKPRISSSVGQDYIKVINMLLLTLPGTPTTYYGEEIGMVNINNASRDPQRSPMQWSDGPNAGFSDANHTWLPMHPHHTTVNVEAQQKDSGSVLSQYRALSLLRQAQLPLHRGWMCYVWSDADVFAFLREIDGLDKAFLVVLNFGADSVINLSAITELPEKLTLHMSTKQENYGMPVIKSSISTARGEGLLLEYSTHVRFNPGHASQCFVSEKACYLGVLDILYKC
ncbi:unnamed protein product [Coregonus sp. 'balchen']|nr:unnamed protein product [Coregonus sp. 'balchen']